MPATVPNRFGNTEGIRSTKVDVTNTGASAVTVAGAVKTTNSTYRMGEREVNLGNIAGAGAGACPIGTAEIAGSGSNEFFRITSGDEIDTFFRIPDDYDGTQSAYLYTYYAIATGAIATNDTITPNITYQIPTLGSQTAGLGDAASSEGVTNGGSITLGTGVVVGSMYATAATLSSACTIAAGGFAHFKIMSELSGEDDVEVRLYNKAVFKYARAYV